MTRIPLSCLALALLAPPLLTLPAHAAESYDNCAGTIATLPAVISTQGVWCLKKDLTTALTVGAAIAVDANNVTIDCNGFKLGGLAAGAGTTAIGIDASGTSNLTVRGCNVRGFMTGLFANNTGGGGHLVEDNRFDGNTLFGIHLYGDGSLIRRNQVIDTGFGTTSDPQRVAGILTQGNVDIIDNAVRVVDSTAHRFTFAYGILVADAGAATVAGNRVSGVVSSPNSAAYAIRPYTGTGVSVRDNDLVGTGNDMGISCSIDIDSVAVGNTIGGFSTAVGASCTDAGNFVYP